jgi:putative ABC transport system permease protein
MSRASGGGGLRPPGWRRWIRVIRRDPMEEVDDELRHHLEMRVEEYMRKGMGEEEARAAARARLGDLTEVRRELEGLSAVESRTERRREWLSELRQDVRYGIRSLLRSPTFSSMAVLTLALGIGATTAIFSLVYAVLLAPLPYPSPDRLVRVWETSPQGDLRNVVSSGNVTDWQERARSFTVLGAHRGHYSQTLTGDGDPLRVVTMDLQPQVMRALNVPPALGRTFTERDAVDGGVAVLSHAFWQTRYGGDPEVLGRRVTVNDVPYTIVGVMPGGFEFPTDDVDLWLPITADGFDPTERTSHNYSVVARLAPGVTVEAAQAEMTSVAAQIAREHPAEMTGWSARVVPLHADLTRNVDALFWVLLGGVVVVLLIACGNLANLLLARAVSREREMAVRGALGAGRSRILRQLLTESGLLAALGGAGALALAPFLLRVLISVAPGSIPLLDRAVIDLRMLGFTAVAGLGCALLFGLVPSIRASRSDLLSALRSGRDASVSGHTRLRSGLLTIQVALSVMLLVSAGLFVRSFRALQGTELGFDPSRLVLMDVDLPFERYPETPEQVSFYDQLLLRVAALPGVQSVAGTSQPPGSPDHMTFSFAIEGRVPSNPNGREDDEPLHAVTPGYFETLDRRIVRGRAFDANDLADGTPVVIINESLARKHWPQGDAVGQRIAFRVGETPWREIVGVVEDARLESPDAPQEPAIYIPFAQKTWTWLSWMTVMARTAPGTHPLALGEGLRSALLELDPELPPQSITTVEAAFRANTAPRRFAMTLVGGFGTLALLLSIVGLYGLITSSVARQRREIGVRIALGAQAGNVVGGVLKHTLLLTLAGTGAGVLGALAAARFLQGLLFGVSAMDLPTYILTVGLVTAVALLTALLPAARAARTDPVRALASD